MRIAYRVDADLPACWWFDKIAFQLAVQVGTIASE
jgi:hypothetical protein